MGPRINKRILAGLAATALLAGANVSPANAGQDTIGFSPISWSIPAMVGISHGFQGIAASMGLNAVLAPDPNFDSATAKKNIESWITNGTVKGFWSITPGVPSTLQSTLALAISKGVVAVVNGVPKDYGYDKPQQGISFAVIDYAKEGTEMGKAIGECLIANKLPTGKIIYGASPAGTIGKKDLETAFNAAFKKAAPKASILRTVTLKGDQATQQSSIRTAIQAAPTAVGFVTQTDEGGLGSVAAYKSAGKKGICLVSAGGGDAAIAAVKSKALYADIALDFGADIAQNIAELKRMIANPTGLGVQLTTPVKVYK